MGQSCCCCCRRNPADGANNTQGLHSLEEQDLNICTGCPGYSIDSVPNPLKQYADYDVEEPPGKVMTFEVDFVVALHSYTACGDNELSFERGETLEVLNKSDEDWWLARYPDQSKTGYIPVPFVALSSSLESYEWYHGEMTRMQTEQLLMSKLNSPGAFLMRKSSRLSLYVLSVKTFNKDGTIRINHYKIIPRNDSGFELLEKFFLTLEDLVDYFINDVYVGLPPTIPKYPCMRLAPMIQDISMETRDQWEIPRHEVCFDKKLGSGSFGEVWLGKWNNSVDIAIKTMKTDKMNAEDFLSEAKVMKTLRHPNILTLYAVCTEQTPLLIITEYMSGGALLDVLREESLKMKLKLHIATQAADGMEYLESQQLIHRDLAARNILVGPCYLCKVADFGLSKIYEDAIYDKTPSKGKMPIKWTAPEALLHHKYTSKSDVWSFGVMMMEIVTDGAIPYPGFTNQQVVESLLEGYRMPQPQNCPPKVYDLIRKCWNTKPEERPTFYFLHDYLENFDVQSENEYYGED